MATVPATHTFAPHPERFGLGSMGAAFVAHGFLIAALTWGTAWRSNNEIATASAELWAEIPVQAAPALAEAPPTPEPVVKKQAKKTAEIVTEKIKKRDQPEPAKKEHEAERQRELLRQDNLKRMAGLANATGSPNSMGTAQMAAGSRADYDAFIRSVIEPNISYQDIDFDKTPLVTEVIFDIASDGTILRPLVYKTSGNKDWDLIAVRALVKTNTIPRDKKGFRPDSVIALVKPKGQK